VTHPFLALTDDDREEMLKTIGVSSIDELFRDIPASMLAISRRALPSHACSHRFLEVGRGRVRA